MNRVMDEDREKEIYCAGYAGIAGDDLCAIAGKLEDFRNVVMGLIGCATVDKIERAAAAEEAVAEIVYKEWCNAQETLMAASERDLEDTDTTWMDLPMPTYFSKDGEALTVPEYHAMERRLRAEKVKAIA